MAGKRRLLFIIGLAALGIVVAAGVLGHLPAQILPIEQKPEQAPQENYDHYVIVDAETEEPLMFVPLKVNVGDELISEKNKRYQVVRIEENRAYARFVENVNIEQYSPKPK
ncbi:MAG: stage II sporulation protein P [Negativicutes bacterium]|nr:stage II sporulation protein P [Negativicutes bacterium]